MDVCIFLFLVSDHFQMCPLCGKEVDVNALALHVSEHWTSD